MADVAGWGADQPADGLPLLVLAHVQPDHQVLAAEQCLRQRQRPRPRELGLADAGRAEEEETADGTAGVGQPGPGAQHRLGDRADGLALPDDTLAKVFLQPEQAGLLLLGEVADRYPGLAGDHLGDVLGGDLQALPVIGLRAVVGLPSAVQLADTVAQFGGPLVLFRGHRLVLVPGQPLDFAFQGARVGGADAGVAVGTGQFMRVQQGALDRGGDGQLGPRRSLATRPVDLRGQRVGVGARPRQQSPGRLGGQRRTQQMLGVQSGAAVFGGVGASATSCRAGSLIRRPMSMWRRPGRGPPPRNRAMNSSNGPGPESPGPMKPLLMAFRSTVPARRADRARCLARRDPFRARVPGRRPACTCAPPARTAVTDHVAAGRQRALVTWLG